MAVGRERVASVPYADKPMVVMHAERGSPPRTPSGARENEPGLPSWTWLAVLIGLFVLAFLALTAL